MNYTSSSGDILIAPLPQSDDLQLMKTDLHATIDRLRERTIDAEKVHIADVLGAGNEATSNQKKRQYLADNELMTNQRELFEILHMPMMKECYNSLKKGDIVVDIGCGKGHAISTIAAIKGVKAYGVDIYTSKSDVNVTRFEHDLDDGLPQPLKEQVKENITLAYSRCVLQYLANPMKVIKETYDSLAPGGHAVLHLGWSESFGKDLLSELAHIAHDGNGVLMTLKDEIVTEYEGKRYASHGIYLVLTKNERPLILPEVIATKPNKTFAGQQNSHNFYVYHAAKKEHINRDF